MLSVLVILALLTLPSIIATTSNDMEIILTNAKDGKILKQTFRTLQKGSRSFTLSVALTQIAAKGYTQIVVSCLKAVQDPCPNDAMCVNHLMDRTLEFMFMGSFDSETVANVILSFNRNDVKPFICIRSRILQRNDIGNILEKIMLKSPTLITDDLSKWLASHAFDRISSAHNGTSLEQAFKYLSALATQDVLEKTLSILEKNEHYKMDDGCVVRLLCCTDSNFSHHLFNRIKGLLDIVKARNAPIVDALNLLPLVSLNLILDYIQMTPSDC